jgi:hypothetical protein
VVKAMFKGFKNLFSRMFQKDKSQIVLENDGFSLIDKGSCLFQVKHLGRALKGKPP